MNVQILLGYLQPVHLNNQSHRILGLDHHQPSPQTPLVSMCILTKTKQGCLSFSPDLLSTSKFIEYSNTCGLEYSRPEGVVQAGTFHTEDVKTHYYNICTYSVFQHQL